MFKVAENAFLSTGNLEVAVAVIFGFILRYDLFVL